MKTNEKIFRPNLGSMTGFDQLQGLDANTPRGLFLAASGNRYLICDDPKRRFAIALQHDTLEPFTEVRLKRSAIEMGKWLGVGYFALDELIDYHSTEMYTGTLHITPGTASLLVTDGRDRFAVKQVAHGVGGKAGWTYGKWALLVHGRSEFFRYETGQNPPFMVFE